MRERLIWISAGLLGLVLAAAMASATSRVATPDVGLAGEPIAAGQALAPPTSKVRRNLPVASRAKARPAKRKRAKKRAAPRSVARRAAATAPAAATPAASAPAAAATPAPARTRPRRTGSTTRATAKSRPKSVPAVKANVNRPAVPARIPTPPPTVTVDDHGGGGDASGKDRSGDGSGKGGGDAGSGGGKIGGGGDD
jgi:uncharacterized membrane protein YgcG